MFCIKYSAFYFVFQFSCHFLIAQLASKPFPQHTHYTKGTIKPNHVSQQQMDDSVRTFYTSWKERYIKIEKDSEYYVSAKRNGLLSAQQCVSEGQGYGMAITVLMAGYDSSAQKTYDGLYRYYKAHPSQRSPYLMAWAQGKHLKNEDETSATDGDMDIAYSLLLANTQWGSKGNIDYLAEAKEVISAIAKQEINTKTYSILLSNAVEFDSKDYFDMRSSDFMPAHYRAFLNVSRDDAWNRVINSNYRNFDSLQKKYSPNAGLLPDFFRKINKNVKPVEGKYLESKHDGDYNYNACRVPWRIATDYIMYGDKRSKAIVEKINKWISATTHGIPKNISSGYTLKGVAYSKQEEEEDFDGICFMAPFAVSAMVDTKNQIWLNRLWDYTVHFGLGKFDYYSNTIKMLDLIILTGNYWTPNIQ